MKPILMLYLSTLILCFGIGVFCIKSFDKKNIYILIYVGINIVVEITGGYYLYFSTTKTIISHLYNYQAILEIVLLGGYFQIFLDSNFLKKIITFLKVAIPIICLYFEFFSKQNQFANYQYFIISNFIFVILSIVGFRQLLEKQEIINDPNFWIITGILFFNAGFFFLSGFINYISSKDLELARKLFIINHLLNIIYYSLITYGFICQRRLVRLLS